MSEMNKGLLTSLTKTVLDKYSRLTWWTIPDPGGTMKRLSNAFEPH